MPSSALYYWGLVGSAWEVQFSALLSWIATFIFIVFVADKKSTYSQAFLASVVLNLIGFCWVYDAIANISQLPTPGVTLFFALFMVINSIYYPLFLLLYRNLPNFFDRYYLKGALAWAAIECLPLRLFPWRLGHTQFAFKPFVQIAELGGVISISFLMFWISELLYSSIAQKKGRYAIYSLAVFGSVLIFGIARISHFIALRPPTIKALVVQPGNLDGKNATEIEESYKGQTDAMSDSIDLVVWPVVDLLPPINESVFNSKNDGSIPRLNISRNLMFGLETYRRPKKKFKSVMLVEKDGNIPLPYHKHYFIPFGEYIPWKDIFPWLKFINPNLVEHDQGSGSKVFNLHTNSGTVVPISPVICYEALIPEYINQAVINGAEVLVVISNDYWTGLFREIPTNQHNVITQFRSIENRRSFVRVTKQGISSIVDPIGNVMAEVRDSNAAVLVGDLPLNSEKTLYSRYGDDLWKILSVTCILLCLFNWLRREG